MVYRPSGIFSRKLVVNQLIDKIATRALNPTGSLFQSILLKTVSEGAGGGAGLQGNGPLELQERGYYCWSAEPGVGAITAEASASVRLLALPAAK
jgi:hypothetical protein